MKCPTDGATLVMSERSGVEIDYCPDCRGVWLDRGELDKIIDRAGPDPLGQTTPPPPPAARYEPAPVDEGRYGSPFDDGPVPGPPPPPAPMPGYGHPGGRGYHPDDRRDPRYRRKRKDSWLEDLFDFD
ncbi:zf-TFIIB domain-containing protein [Ruania suaedae]|uniref:TFIIB-type zinc ribbon-containing protein n=1 Tax=Ruania suaedae TaxID=2897774 RepID=UPI001E4E8B97|nr:zf-TFIIB domain-containing protein [Ruania suaedae]UFU03014.1 zf-TFIIB domain-containing protein [Ruania suaedae]